MKEKDLLALINEKLGVESLNEMQRLMLDKSKKNKNIILLSPTGSGKTLAFILPVINTLKKDAGRVQCVVIAPSRELVMQIAKVARQITPGFRVVELYGGHKVEDEVNALKVTPDIIISTPGRLLDHSVRHNTELLQVSTLVLDEFDKSLELGFEEEMKKLLSRMKNVSRFILTSATKADILPEFLKMEKPVTIDFTQNNTSLKERITLHEVRATEKDKLADLANLLRNIATISEGKLEKIIVFANHRESAERIYQYLKKHSVDCVLYHGALEQRERETAVALFNNGSRPILIATDLAARGLDIEKVASVIHYHQPLTEQAFIHRNGRTARIEEEGDVYLLVGPDEEIKDFIKPDKPFPLDPNIKHPLKSNSETLYINDGKKEKLSKGDILGFLTKEAGLPAADIGRIDIFDHYSLVNIQKNEVAKVLQAASTGKIKGKKRKISLLK